MPMVLVVDDEEALLEIITDIVAALGYVAVAAHDGAEALAQAKKERPDLILSDQMMPRLTGLELLRQVRRDPNLRSVPFILMSAASPRGADEATRFLSKPIDLETLEQAIRGELRENRAAPPQRPPLRAATQTLRPRSELLLWIGHEMRTPIAAARLNAEVLARQINAADLQNRGRAQALVDQLTVLNETLASLIDIAELLEGGQPPPLIDEDLALLVDEVVHDWRSRIPYARVNVHMPPWPIVFRFDRERIRRVMNTLVANSLRHSGGRATIDFSVEAQPSGAVLRMTGNSLPRELMDHPIDPDQLAHSGVEDLSVLPLYLAAVVARAHQGSVVVNAEPDQRATVSLQLPRR